MTTEIVQYHELDCGEWNRVVNEYYKPISEWDFIDDHEADNDSNYSFNVYGEIDELGEEQLIKFRKDSNSQGWMTQTLLDDLCQKGIIGKGRYSIKVRW